MKISFDYDNTISEDLEGWHQVMNLMRDRGHEVFVVTFRDEKHDWNDDLIFLLEDDFDIHFTGGVAKRWWCEHFGPGKVDVWVDDTPEAIINNSSFSPTQLVEWREGNMSKEYVSEPA